jgi:hypothetical protein
MKAEQIVGMATYRKEKIGQTLIGVGGFLIFLGAVFSLAVYFGSLPNQSWVLSWITTYRVSLGGAIIGAILLGAGLYTRSSLEKSTQKISELEKTKKAQKEKLSAKSIALSNARVDAGRKEVVLKRTRGKLRRARRKLKKAGIKA